MDDNLSLQIDEIEALTAIYEDKLQVLSEASRSYLFQVSTDPSTAFGLEVRLPPTYPSCASPDYELHAPWLKAADKQNIRESLNKIYVDSCGSNILYEWIEFVKDFVDSKTAEEDEKKFVKTVSTSIELLQIPVPTIIHGEPFTDRRSTFQAHLASITCVSDVKIVKTALMENRKISNATHNIVAYRIISNGTVLQDCDDDGETAAGGRLLHLLQILDVKNVIMVVSRWYGGILLGPDRFKHINNVARTLLVSQGHVKQNR